ncbi:hypothetical protein [Paraconexibacter algicola]|uniref:hypothetical protein n=1 Tax=Paraconexibacter algicola TaxID=2133960 RepID=UPI0011B26A9B|nr:hypothetical protein [Paraconexibacter algicola]
MPDPAVRAEDRWPLSAAASAVLADPRVTARTVVALTPQDCGFPTVKGKRYNIKADRAQSASPRAAPASATAPRPS